LKIDEPEAMRELHEIRVKQYEECKNLSDVDWIEYIRRKAADCRVGYDKGQNKSVLETESSVPIVEPESMREIHRIREKMHEEYKNLSSKERVQRIKDKSDT
jgi:hypothetical protein